jgi:hypothetical protein
MQILYPATYLSIAILYYVTGLSYKVHVDSSYYLAYELADVSLLDGEVRSELLFVQILKLFSSPFVYPLVASFILSIFFVFIGKRLATKKAFDRVCFAALALNPYLIHLSASILKDATLLILCLAIVWFAINRKLFSFCIAAVLACLIRPAYAAFVVMLFSFGWKLRPVYLNSLIFVLICSIVFFDYPLTVNDDFTGSEYLKLFWFRLDQGIPELLGLITSYFFVAIFPSFMFADSLSEFSFGFANWIAVFTALIVYIKVGKEYLLPFLLVDFLFFCLSPAPTAFMRYRMSLVIASSIFVLMKSREKTWNRRSPRISIFNRNRYSIR